MFPGSKLNERSLKELMNEVSNGLTFNDEFCIGKLRFIFSGKYISEIFELNIYDALMLAVKFGYYHGKHRQKKRQLDALEKAKKRIKRLELKLNER